MQEAICRCNVCLMEKGVDNGWFAVRANAWFIALPFDQVIEDRPGDHEHVCGQECLHKRLSQWLENNSRPAPAISQEAE